MNGSNATQGIILLMLAALVLYLVWRDGLLDQLTKGSGHSGGAERMP